MSMLAPRPPAGDRPEVKDKLVTKSATLMRTTENGQASLGRAALPRPVRVVPGRRLRRWRSETPLVIVSEHRVEST